MTRETERLRDQHRATLALLKAMPLGPARHAALQQLDALAVKNSRRRDADQAKMTRCTIRRPEPSGFQELDRRDQSRLRKRDRRRGCARRPRSSEIAPHTGEKAHEMTDSPKLSRMVGTGTCTEINDTRFGLLVPDADNAIFVPQECVAACEKSGFRVRELTHSEKLGRVMDAIGELDDGADKTALRAAFGAQQLLVWRARQARQAGASPA